MILLAGAGPGRLAVLLDASEPPAVAGVLRSLLNVREDRNKTGFFIPVNDFPVLCERLDRLGITQATGRREMDDVAALAVRSHLAKVELDNRIKAGELNEEVAPLLGAVKSTLWPDQVSDVRYCTRHQRVGVFSELGTGKTAIAFSSFAALKAAGLARYALVICPSAVKQNWLRQVKQHTTLSAVELGNGRATVLQRIRKYTEKRSDVCVIHYDALRADDVRDRLVALPYDSVIIDECFTGFTNVITPTGPRRIDSLFRGDLVFAHDMSVQVVEATRSSEPSELFRLVLGMHLLYCTGNHPFLTTDGWRQADALRPEDKVVCVVPGEICGTNPREPILWHELFCQVENEPTGDSVEGLQPRSQCEKVKNLCCTSRCPPGDRGGIISTHDRTKPDEKPGDTEEGFRNSPQYRPPSPVYWRERQAACRTTRETCSSTWMGLRISRSDRKTAPLLQDRHRKPINKSSSRSGWADTWQPKGAGGGCTQGSISGIARLDRVESVERGCTPPNGYNGRVYNLQVSGPHTYLVEGGYVVHNCHIFKNAHTQVSRAITDVLARIRPSIELVEAEVMLPDGTVTTAVMQKGVKPGNKVDFL